MFLHPWLHRLSPVSCSAAIAVFILLASPLAYAQSPSDAWLEQIESPETVAAHYTHEDEIEQAALRESALRAIRDYIEEYIGRRADLGQLTVRERAVRDAFNAARKEIQEEMDRKYGELEDRSTYQKYWNRRSSLRYNEAFLISVFEQFAPPLAQRMGPQLRQQAEREQVKEIATILFPILKVAVPASFIYLLFSSWIDRRTQQGVSISEGEGRVEVTYKQGKFGPLAALSIYPVYFNILLFLLTLSVGLIFLFAAVENSEWMKRLESKPLPDFMKIVFYREFWVGIGLTILTAPWWLLALANIRRNKRLSVVVTNDGYEVGSKRYGKELAHGCFVTGTGVEESPEPESTMIVSGGTAASRAAASGAMHRAAIAESAGRFKRSLGRVQHRVMLDHGEQTRTLAKKLPLRRAELVHAALYDAAERLHHSSGDSLTTTSEPH